MILSKTFERLSNGQNQVIELALEVNNKSQIEDAGYDDFKAFLYIGGKFIADISPVLSNIGCFTEMVDDVNWFDLFDEKNIYSEIAY